MSSMVEEMVRIKGDKGYWEDRVNESLLLSSWLRPLGG